MATSKRDTAYGTLLVAQREELYQALIDEMARAADEGASSFSIGLTGGSTPKAFYEWAARNNKVPSQVVQRALWMTTDERFVPRSSEESNFGNADRLLLDPYAIPENRRLNWPTQVDPHSASIVFNRKWNERFGSMRCFDLAMFGMGEDGHTASLFPGSAILGAPIPDNFACVEVPGKGWRLTTTESGMSRCGRIVVIVTGAAKAQMLARVLEPGGDPVDLPAKIYGRFSDKTLWLVDPEAASELDLEATSS